MCLGLDIWVTKIMHPRVRDTDGSDHFLEILVHGMDCKMMTKIIRKHKAGFLPMLRSLETGFKLDVPMMTQQFHYPRRGRNRPGFIIFQRGEYILAALFLFALELLVNQDNAPLILIFNKNKTVSKNER